MCARVCVWGGEGGRHDPPIHVHFLIDFDYCVYHFCSVLYSASYFWAYFQRPFSNVSPKSLSYSFSTCLLTGSLLPKESTTNFLSTLSLLPMVPSRNS